MKRYKPIFTKVKEADDNEAKTLEAVKALIDMKDISNEDEQGKFIELLKGIVFANNAHGDNFLKQINDFTSGLKIEDFKEGCKKKPKKKDMKEAIRVSNKNQAFEAISGGVSFLIQTNSKMLMQGYLINAIIDGIESEDDLKLDAAVDETVFNKRLLFIIKELKDKLK